MFFLEHVFYFYLLKKKKNAGSAKVSASISNFTKHLLDVIRLLYAVHSCIFKSAG